MSEEDLRAEIERRLLAEDCGLAPSADVLRLLDDVARAESERDAARESLRIDRETSHVAIATLRNDAALGRAVRNSGVTLDWLTERGRELRNSRGSLSLSSGAYAAAHAQEIVGNEESEEVCDG